MCPIEEGSEWVVGIEGAGPEELDSGVVGDALGGWVGGWVDDELAVCTGR